MIQENELRIGNLFQDEDGTHLYVAGIWNLENGKYQYMDSGRNTYTKGQLYPIPLTPELLEQCGFSQDRGGFVLPDKMSLSISVTKDNEYLPCWMDHALYPGAWRTVKHLHQLQNLYFALTGQELEINLKVK